MAVAPGWTWPPDLPKGESFPLLPWARALMEDRAKRPGDDPFYWCMPMGVPRVTPYPYRFVQNYTLKPTHMYILHEGTIHTYRQIFMDGRKHPAELDPAWFGHSIGAWEKDTLVIDTVGYNDKFWFDRAGRRIPSNCTPSNGGPASPGARWSMRSPSTTRAPTLVHLR